MIQTGFESRVKVQQIISNQLPEFILDESPKTTEFLKQYYISQEFQGGPVDIAENLDQYLKLDYLSPEVITDSSILTSDLLISDDTIFVSSTKGFPKSYGLLRIDDEIITYTGITTNSFTGCIRGFSGVTNYKSDLNKEELVFESSSASHHKSGVKVLNLSTLFLKEFYEKFKYTFAPGLENYDLVPELNVGNFLKEIRSFYQSKGSEESFKILFNVLFGITPKVIDLEQYLFKPSSAEYIRRDVIVVEALSGDPSELEGQSIRKIDDPSTTASVSEVEIFTRNNITFYKLFLFSGLDDSSPKITGNFGNTQSTRIVDRVSIGSSVITVDSTIGFNKSGSFTCGNNNITYTDKNINQFLNCSGVLEECLPNNLVISSNKTYIGYENGDVSKPVHLRVTNVLSKFVQISDFTNSFVGEKIRIKSIGNIINSKSNTRLQNFSNSWIYNTSVRYQIEKISNSGSTVTLKSFDIDNSSLRLGDEVEILRRNSQNVLSQPPISFIVINKNELTRQVDLSANIFNLTEYNSNYEYDIRRKIKKASSSVIPIDYGNNSILADVQNLYTSGNNFSFVASNSLPSQYSINIGINQIFINEASIESLAIDPSSLTSEGFYSVISFASDLPQSFIDGTLVYYKPEFEEIPGLSEGLYYLQLIDKNRIRLYNSISLIGTDKYEKFLPLPPGSGKHTFILSDQNLNTISGAKLLKKFPITPNLSKSGELTSPGSVGLLVNGVEILNYKSEDKIYYGPLRSVSIINSGKNYDVLRPPLIEIFSLTGTGAKIQPVVSGNIKKVFVSPQEFDINSVVSIRLVGGNGKGCNLEPLINIRRRELEFDARDINNFGNLDPNNDLISFPTPHNLINGEPIVYDPSGNLPIGIGTFGEPFNIFTGLFLSPGGTYYPRIINDRTIQLYQSIVDYNSGINTIGITTQNNTGLHKFRTAPKKTLAGVKVTDPGVNYTNRKLIVKPTGISTVSSSIFFENHGFLDGEIVKYDYETSSISGLSTSLSYAILKLDNDSFRLSDAGVDGTTLENYRSRRYVSFNTSGSGYQYFSYPEISVNVDFTNVGLGTTVFTKTIDAYPVVTGSIIDAYLYENGLDYGSTILNLHKKPNITIKTGKNAQLDPVIVNGRIVGVTVLYGGEDYYSTPSITIIGAGNGAELRAVVENNKIKRVIISNSGFGYDNRTKLKVVSTGSQAQFNVNVRSLTVNNYFKYGSQVLLPSTQNKNSLQYYNIGYDSTLRSTFNDTSTNKHSPIIGWAYDGNPIYGSYGYIDPENQILKDTVKLLTNGYTLDPNNIFDRPSIVGFPTGFFVEDYKFTNSGDLDAFNGRFCKTPEFPEGVYAYFASVGVVNSVVQPFFPYFVGNSYKSEFYSENKLLDQSFNFEDSNLIRNTFPYKIGSEFVENDFIVDSTNILKKKEKAIVDSVTNGKVDSVEIIEPGSDYKVGDTINFVSDFGSGIDCKISSILGIGITSINTTVQSYSGALVFWDSPGIIKIKIKPYHEFKNNDEIIISDISNNDSKINGSYTIGVTSSVASIASSIPQTSTVGLITDIYLSYIPPQSISRGSSITINSEIFSVVDIFVRENILRVQRSLVGISHNIGSLVYFNPDSFTIKKDIPYFESKDNDEIFFNPAQTLGIGRTSGISDNKNYTIGVSQKTISVPTQSIYLPNHPFKTNQQVTLKIPDFVSNKLGVSTSSSSSQFDIPISGTEQTVFIINKSKDYIGIVTQVGLTTTTDGLFFTSFTRNGDGRDFKYSLETVFEPVTAQVERRNSIIEVISDHNLSNGDEVEITLKSNNSVGIGTSTAVRIVYNDVIRSITINPITFNGSSVNISTNSLTLINHGLKTGDKVFYDADIVSSGLQTGTYFVYRVNDNQIKLSETKSNLSLNPAIFADITSTGGSSQSISLVNPRIEVIKNNDLVFDITHPSLLGYDFGLFYDTNFVSQFVSTGSNSSFSTQIFGSIGTGTTSRYILKYSDDLPEKLYYTISQNGRSIPTDTEVDFRSEISFINSKYSGKFNVTGITSTTFDIILKEIPEKLNYNQDDCDLLIYSTKSKTASGGIDKIDVISGGNYKDIPIFSGSSSQNGNGAYVIANSKSIGNINQVILTNEAIEYSTDTTLKPVASIFTDVIVDSSNEIKSISILSGGKNYTSAPNLVIYDPKTNKIIESGIIEAKLTGNTITSVNVIVSPKGLPARSLKLRAINNSNGIGITKVEYSSGTVTCTIITPILGYDSPPFFVGEKIWVEGIKKEGESGTGFNCSDYNYELFEITGVDFVSNPSTIQFNLSNLTSNPGTPITFQDSFATIVPEGIYPRFLINQVPSEFVSGEQLFTKLPKDTSYTLRDLFVERFNTSFIKVSGTYDLSPEEVIRGRSSNTIAQVYNIRKNFGEFDVDYSSRQNYGWINQTGVLDDDNQVLPDNDYYQNLSYSVKSPITFNEFISPVNSLVHTTGLKNFADTQIFSSGAPVVSIGLTDKTNIIVDYISERRVDTINNYDFAIDIDTTNGSSKYIKFKTKKLTDYILLKTNRVLTIDDFSDQFSNKDSINANFNVEGFKILDEIDSGSTYNSYIIQVYDLANDSSEVHELVSINDNKNIFVFRKNYISSGEYDKFSEIVATKNDTGNDYVLRFSPVDPFNNSYDIKIWSQKFNSFITNFGIQSIGFVNLIGSNRVLNTIGVNSTTIYEISSTFNAVHTTVQIINDITKEINYLEIYVAHDGVDTYKSEYYFNNEPSALSFNSSGIGTFVSYLSGGLLKLDYIRPNGDKHTIRSKHVGFGQTSLGTSTYRFLEPGQPAGTELSGLYKSNYALTSGPTPVTYDTFSSGAFTVFKGIVQIIAENNISLHQIITLNENSKAYTTQYPFISIGSTSGIGTFGCEYSGSDIRLRFYPDASISGIVTVKSLTQGLYKQLDSLNIPDNLVYGPVVEKISVTPYFGINDERFNTLVFPLKHKNIPIFEKTFNPSNSSQLNPQTGVITIPNHFFSTGEELIYAPVSTFAGIPEEAVGIGSTLNSVGIVTNILPSNVYAIKLSNDSIKLATRRDYAIAGIGVTFTDLGSGNAHKLEMAKKLEKSIISIDNLIQSPISFTSVNHTLFDNGGSISIGSSYISLSGISSIFPEDLIKINDEYVRVIKVGLGTTAVGPITNSGSFNLVEVSRGFVGSSATSHLDGSEGRIYRGSYNIVGNNIYFTQPPNGNAGEEINSSNILDPQSEFNGRVFLRQDYSTNVVYDLLSAEFTGIGQTYTLTVSGVNTTGIGSEGGNGILLINNIFQSPSTQNNKNNNYEINESGSSTQVTFTGITSVGGSIIISENDVNQNQLPRGGLVVSLGSTNGLGFAPLVGASVTAVVSAAGTIVSVGLGTTDYLGSGYNGLTAIGVSFYQPGHTGSNAVVNARVGAGGTLSFRIINGGSGYSPNPKVFVSPPSYENLEVIGVSRLGIGSTTDTGTGLLVSLQVSASSTTGIGSTLFEVSSYKVSRSGYGFRVGDVIKPVGLVTAIGYNQPLLPFELTVTEVFNDTLSAWQFGELNYIDSIKDLQNGSRTRFPLNYNGELLSFEIDQQDPDSALIEYSPLLLIFVNGILQEPDINYSFVGGSSFIFSTAPKPTDNVAIFFYIGTRDVDSFLTPAASMIKEGDTVQLTKYNVKPKTITQDERTVFSLFSSDIIETNLYTGIGVDDQNFKPLSWTKQKKDLKINGLTVGKSRDSIETTLYPSAKIIKDVTTSDTTIYLDTIDLLDYENIDVAEPIGAILVDDSKELIPAKIEASVGIGSTVILTIVESGFGYTGSSLEVSIGSPPFVSVGIGTIATATVSVVNGSLGIINVTNPGFGYDPSKPPNVLIPSPAPIYENVSGILKGSIKGNKGSILGISTTRGVGTPLALTFTLSSAADINIGDAIYIYDTKIGSGVTSINLNNNDKVAIGTQFVDNVYYVHFVNNATGIVTCNILSTTSTIGLSSTGTRVGKFSWGRISNVVRSENPVSIAVTEKSELLGLSTYPSLQRRNYGLRDTGALVKIFQ